MNTAIEVSKIVHELNFHAPLLREIQSESEHEQALELMEELLEDYERPGPAVYIPYPGAASRGLALNLFAGILGPDPKHCKFSPELRWRDSG